MNKQLVPVIVWIIAIIAITSSGSYIYRQAYDAGSVAGYDKGYAEAARAFNWHPKKELYVRHDFAQIGDDGRWWIQSVIGDNTSNQWSSWWEPYEQWLQEHDRDGRP